MSEAKSGMVLWCGIAAISFQVVRISSQSRLQTDGRISSWITSSPYARHFKPLDENDRSKSMRSLCCRNICTQYLHCRTVTPILRRVGGSRHISHIELSLRAIRFFVMASGERTLWQRRFWEHTIQDETDFVRQVDY